MTAARIARLLPLLLALGAPATSRAADEAGDPQLQYLVPELAEHPFRVDGGDRAFLNRLSFSPSYGSLGSQRLYSMRLAYSPNSWLGWEAGIGHNPGESVHALLHTLDAVVRKPLPGRVQPYVRGGYGMMLVYPGESLNADPVTANLLCLGGGVELYVRNDVALRADGAFLTALAGGSEDATAARDYQLFTVGLSFYRGLGE